MFAAKRIMKIIDGLKDADALLMVVWDAAHVRPRVYLKEWCGAYRHSVSIGTAECVLDQIMLGKIKKPVIPAITHKMRRNAVVTGFLEGRA